MQTGSPPHRSHLKHTFESESKTMALTGQAFSHSLQPEHLFLSITLAPVASSCPKASKLQTSTQLGATHCRQEFTFTTPRSKLLITFIPLSCGFDTPKASIEQMAAQTWHCSQIEVLHSTLNTLRNLFVICLFSQIAISYGFLIENESSSLFSYTK